MGVAYSIGEVDHLKTFFVEWSPAIYTKGHKKHRQHRYLVRDKKKCYLVVKKAKEALTNMDLSSPGEGLKIINVMESKHRHSLSSAGESEAEETDDLRPVLRDDSLLLNDQDLETLANHMPVRTQGYPWKLAYSTMLHGSSLKTLYRKLAGLDSPILLVIKDVHQKVFGAFSSDPFKVTRYCYGTGETFLYTFNPDFKAYRWTEENSYFVRGHSDSLLIGGGGTGIGLWLDADLFRGSSSSCATFDNPTLSTHQDFTIQAIEVWTILCGAD